VFDRGSKYLTVVVTAYIKRTVLYKAFAAASLNSNICMFHALKKTGTYHVTIFRADMKHILTGV
jgi:hypothetical protein